MTAREFKKIYNTMRPPTARKILNGLRKYNVRDASWELEKIAGGYLSSNDLAEFADCAKEDRVLKSTGEKIQSFLEERRQWIG
jgi:hypothetical protein